MRFNIGDEVRVIAIGHGISDPWYIGKKFKIMGIDEMGWIFLEGDHLNFIWNPELIVPVKEFTPYYNVIRVINKIKAKREALGYQW